MRSRLLSDLMTAILRGQMSTPPLSGEQEELFEQFIFSPTTTCVRELVQFCTRSPGITIGLNTDFAPNVDRGRIDPEGGNVDDVDRKSRGGPSVAHRRPRCCQAHRGAAGVRGHIR